METMWSSEDITMNGVRVFKNPLLPPKTMFVSSDIYDALKSNNVAPLSDLDSVPRPVGAEKEGSNGRKDRDHFSRR